MLSLIPKRFDGCLQQRLAAGSCARLTGRSVDAATNELADKLPDRVVHAADALPGDVMRAGGATLAASRVAAKGIKATSAKAKDQTQKNLDEIRGDIAVETELARRSLWSDFLRFTGRDDEATNALLDVRTDVDPSSEPGRAFQRVPNPVAVGRKLLKRARA